MKQSLVRGGDDALGEGVSFPHPGGQPGSVQQVLGCGRGRAVQLHSVQCTGVGCSGIRGGCRLDRAEAVDGCD